MAVRKIIFEEESFSGLHQADSESFQISAHDFEHCLLDCQSFSHMTQANLSLFLLSLNGKHLSLNEHIFSGLTQAKL